MAKYRVVISDNDKCLTAQNGQSNQILLGFIRDLKPAYFAVITGRLANTMAKDNFGKVGNNYLPGINWQRHMAFDEAISAQFCKVNAVSTPYDHVLGLEAGQFYREYLKLLEKAVLARVGCDAARAEAMMCTSGSYKGKMFQIVSEAVSLHLAGVNPDEIEGYEGICQTLGITVPAVADAEKKGQIKHLLAKIAKDLKLKENDEVELFLFDDKQENLTAMRKMAKEFFLDKNIKLTCRVGNVDMEQDSGKKKMVSLVDKDGKDIGVKREVADTFDNTQEVLGAMVATFPPPRASASASSGAGGRKPASDGFLNVVLRFLKKHKINEKGSLLKTSLDNETLTIGDLESVEMLKFQYEDGRGFTIDLVKKTFCNDGIGASDHKYEEDNSTDDFVMHINGVPDGITLDVIVQQAVDVGGEVGDLERAIRESAESARKSGQRLDVPRQDAIEALEAQLSQLSASRPEEFDAGNILKTQELSDTELCKILSKIPNIKRFSIAQRPESQDGKIVPPNMPCQEKTGVEVFFVQNGADNNHWTTIIVDHDKKLIIGFDPKGNFKDTLGYSPDGRKLDQDLLKKSLYLNGNGYNADEYCIVTPFMDRAGKTDKDKIQADDDATECGILCLGFLEFYLKKRGVVKEEDFGSVLGQARKPTEVMLLDTFSEVEGSVEFENRVVTKEELWDYQDGLRGRYHAMVTVGGRLVEDDDAMRDIAADISQNSTPIEKGQIVKEFLDAMQALGRTEIVLDFDCTITKYHLAHETMRSHQAIAELTAVVEGSYDNRDFKLKEGATEENVKKLFADFELFKLLLEEAKKKGVKCSILTKQDKPLVKAILNKVGITDFDEEGKIESMRHKDESPKLTANQEKTLYIDDVKEAPTNASGLLVIKDGILPKMEEGSFPVGAENNPVREDIGLNYHNFCKLTGQLEREVMSIRSTLAGKVSDDLYDTSEKWPKSGLKTAEQARIARLQAVRAAAAVPNANAPISLQEIILSYASKEQKARFANHTIYRPIIREIDDKEEPDYVAIPNPSDRYDFAMNNSKFSSGEKKDIDIAHKLQALLTDQGKKEFNKVLASIIKDVMSGAGEDGVNIMEATKIITLAIKISGFADKDDDTLQPLLGGVNVNTAREFGRLFQNTCSSYGIKTGNINTNNFIEDQLVGMRLKRIDINSLPEIMNLVRQKSMTHDSGIEFVDVVTDSAYTKAITTALYSGNNGKEQNEATARGLGIPSTSPLYPKAATKVPGATVTEVYL